MFEFLLMLVVFYIVLGLLSLFITTWYSPCEDLPDLCNLIALWWYILALIGLYEWDSYRTWPDTYRVGGIYKDNNNYELTSE